MTRMKSDRGTAMVEVALTLPILLLVSVGIVEFGRAYQTMQVMTNAAREGARVAILPVAPEGAVQARVDSYLRAGQILNPGSAQVTVTATDISLGGGATAPGSRVTVTYPYTFTVLGPVARLVVPSSTLGQSFLMSATAEMRNEM